MLVFFHKYSGKLKSSHYQAGEGVTALDCSGPSVSGGQGFHLWHLSLGLGGGGRETWSVLGEEGLVRVVRLNSTTKYVRSL